MDDLLGRLYLLRYVLCQDHLLVIGNSGVIFAFFRGVIAGNSGTLLNLQKITEITTVMQCMLDVKFMLPVFGKMYLL